MSHHVRSKLDEIKRREIERLRLAAIKHVSFFFLILFKRAYNSFWKVTYYEFVSNFSMNLQMI